VVAELVRDGYHVGRGRAASAATAAPAS
jgi:hypothetical protein